MEEGFAGASLSSLVPAARYRRVVRSRAVVLAMLAGLLASRGAAAPAPATTFADAGSRALATLLDVYYTGTGLWNECDRPGCPQGATDWGDDSLTYALALRWRTAGDAAIPGAMAALAASAPAYGTPCQLPSCGSWSDVPMWDAIADLRIYGVTHDPQALAKGEAAFEYVEGANAFALGACPDMSTTSSRRVGRTS